MEKLLPEVKFVEGKPVVSSLDVAEHFGKRHSDVLRAIKNLKIPKDFNGRNFAPVEYVDEKGEKRPMYYLTRDGFTLLAMGFTGKKAMEWKIKYIEAFNKMEEYIRKQQVDVEALLDKVMEVKLDHMAVRIADEIIAEFDRRCKKKRSKTSEKLNNFPIKILTFSSEEIILFFKGIWCCDANSVAKILGFKRGALVEFLMDLGLEAVVDFDSVYIPLLAKYFKCSSDKIREIFGLGSFEWFLVYLTETGIKKINKIDPDLASIIIKRMG